VVFAQIPPAAFSHRLWRPTRTLPEAQKIIKDAGGTYIAGGFNKAKVNYGKPEAGNRYVIIHFENEAAVNKFWDGGGKDWVAKNAPNARNPPRLGRTRESWLKYQPRKSKGTRPVRKETNTQPPVRAEPKATACQELGSPGSLFLMV
jgi:hypothetical protein